MKKLIISILILLAIVTSFYGCRKNDNPKLPENIETGVYPLFVQDTTGDFLIQEMDSFKTSFDVGLYFPNSVMPQKMDIVVVKKDSSKIEDFGTVKLLKADVTTFPTKISVTGPQLAQLFGMSTSQVKNSTTFRIGADITLPNGKVLLAFQQGVTGTDTLNLEPYGADALNLPNANPTITYPKVCPLFMDSLVNVENGGDLVVDDPDFWEDTYNVTATQEGSDVIVLTGWLGLPNAVVKVTIDERRQKATVAKQVYSSTLPTTPYHNPAVAGDGTVNACDNSITLSLENTVDEGSFGKVTVTIKRP
jgi:hypothetical protein